MTQPLPEVDTSLTGSDSGMDGLPALSDMHLAPDMSGDLLPVASSGEFWDMMNSSQTPLSFQNFLYNGDSGKYTPMNGTRGDIIKFAESFIGTPYVWGGTSPSGFDCSGFTQYVAKHFGVSLPRLSQQQGTLGEHMDIKNLQPGDLVLFPNDTNNGMQGPGHVAIYAGNGTIIEAPHTGATVRLRSLGKGELVYGIHLNYPGH